MNAMFLRAAFLAGVCASLGTGGCIHITNTYAGPPSVTERTTETRSIADVRDCGCDRQMIGGYIPYFPNYPAPPVGYNPPPSHDTYAQGPYYYPVPYGYPRTNPEASQPTSGSGTGGEMERGGIGYESEERRGVEPVAEKPEQKRGMEPSVESGPTARRDDPKPDATPTYRPDHRTPSTTHDAPGPRNSGDRPMTTGSGGSIGRSSTPGATAGTEPQPTPTTRPASTGTAPRPTMGEQRASSGSTHDDGATPKPVGSVERRPGPSTPMTVPNSQIGAKSSSGTPSARSSEPGRETRQDEGVKSQERRDVPMTTKPIEEKSVDSKRDEGMKSQERRDVQISTKPVEKESSESKKEEGVKSRERRDVPMTTKPTDEKGTESKVIREAPSTQTATPATHGAEARIRRDTTEGKMMNDE